jgi:hypothetical protein
MIGIWFTYNLDSKCLIESVKSFRRVYPDGIVGICDDAKNPVNEEDIKTIAPDYRELRQWDSKGNLNGWAAIRGMLEFQIKVQDLFPEHSGAIKIDSDTLLLDNSWLDPKSPISGFSLGTSTIFAGMIRYLRSDVPQILLDKFKTRFLWEGAATPEDATIGAYCALLFGSECNSVDWTDGAKSFSYVNLDLNSRKCKVITFGNRKEIKNMGDAEKRDLAGEEMAKYNEKFA